jgi:NADH:ubiquinone oxidoreductase subunit E/NAD-dependent dihydropyrimidine dehydrogenase PreA subunit
MTVNGSLTSAASATNATDPIGAVLVCGGGVAGIQASLDLSAAGFRVYMVEESASIGGAMARLDKTFPTGDCATCIISPKLVECMRDHNVEIYTLSDVTSIEGEAGNFHVKVDQRPRGVIAEKCTGCGDCWEACPVSNVPQDVLPFSPTEQVDESQNALLEYVLERHEGDPAPLLPVLQDVNDARGYLPRPMLESLAVRLDTPISEILRVASFYGAFSLEPVGRHIIEVCLGTACFVSGSGILLNRLEELIGVSAGETDEDERFTLRTVRCIGCCALAPALRIDGVTFGHIKLNKVSQILDRFE